nr:MAG TPA: hypothetical protein [Caudoviricetes sp.]
MGGSRTMTRLKYPAQCQKPYSLRYTYFDYTAFCPDCQSLSV